MSGEIYYLDTSAIVKRYVVEHGSEVVDEVFRDAYRGLAVASFSYWNIAEVAVVFDKYGKILGLNTRELTRNMLREIKTLNRLQKLRVVGITPTLIKNSIQLVFKHHIYVADALQIVSAKTVGSSKFLTGDKKLAKIAEQEGLQSVYIGKH
ncbi:MAG: type II toxin-antitoxin system VapC family toxin [Thermoprotei archaeon]|jgi:predicted nucleic acid-binding protein